MSNQNDLLPEDNNANRAKARNLFFQSTLTQAQIAELVNVSQKTVSVWINEGKWRMIRQRAEKSPTVFIEQMISELQELQAVIAARPAGHRYPTVEEAEIRRKTLLSIKDFQRQQTAGVHSEVLMHFINYIQNIHPGLAKRIVDIADDYLKGEKNISLEPQFSNYELPGEMDENNFLLPPSATDDKPAEDNSQNQAA